MFTFRPVIVVKNSLLHFARALAFASWGGSSQKKRNVRGTQAFYVQVYGRTELSVNIAACPGAGHTQASSSLSTVELTPPTIIRKNRAAQLRPLAISRPVLNCRGRRRHRRLGYLSRQSKSLSVRPSVLPASLSPSLRPTHSLAHLLSPEMALTFHILRGRGRTERARAGETRLRSKRPIRDFGALLAVRGSRREAVWRNATRRRRTA